jgi:predicted lipoprotein with Yx(FWY)xxD motif
MPLQERMPNRERMPFHIEGAGWRARRGMMALVAVAAFAVGACSSAGGGTTPAPTAAVAATTAPASAGSSSTSLALAQDATLGGHVTGANGMSLYVFTPDTATTSACTDACAKTWPPVIVASEADAQLGTGVTGALGTITRADGTKQLTLGGHPLYYFANDKAAGDLNGQGLNGKWFAAGPDGSGLGMTTAPAPSSTTGGIKGY